MSFLWAKLQFEASEETSAPTIRNNARHLFTIRGIFQWRLRRRYLKFPGLFSGLPLPLVHVGLDPADASLESHVMLWGEAALVLPLFGVKLLALFLLPELLEHDYVLALLLEDQLVHLLLNLRLHVLLVEHNVAVIVLAVVTVVVQGLCLLLVVELLDVVEHHQPEGERVKHV